MTTIRILLIALLASLGLQACNSNQGPGPIPDPSISPEPTITPTLPQCQFPEPEPSRKFELSLHTSEQIDLLDWLFEQDPLLTNSANFQFEVSKTDNTRVELTQDRLQAFLQAEQTGFIKINFSKTDPLQANCPETTSHHQIEVTVIPIGCLIPSPGIIEELELTLAVGQSVDLAELFAEDLDSNSSYILRPELAEGDLQAEINGDLLTLTQGTTGQLIVDRNRVFIDGSADYCGEINQVSHRLTISLAEYEPPVMPEDPLPMPIIAYQPSWAFDINRIAWHQLSKIIYSFGLPDFDGSMTISEPQNLAALRDAARDKPTEIWLAIGGWDIGHGGGNDAAWSAIMEDPLLLERFKGEILDAVILYELDGIDVDWEWPSNSTQQAQFLQLMQELHEMLNPMGVELSTAVVSRGANGAFIDSKVFDLVKYINIMAYDDNWPWEAPHSDMNIAQAALNYWVGQRQLPKEKAILGVPFYCRDRTRFIAYRDILARGGDANADEFDGCFYNGLETMEKKARLALERAGGIMFWELSQDVQDERSLLNRIYQTFTDSDWQQPEPGECTLPEFVSDQSYGTGDQVSLNGFIYRAKWWSNTPPPGDSWELVGPC